jgi:uncharacterized membrane protein YecN with MAPEG domain
LVALLGLAFLVSRVLHVFGLELMQKPIGLKLRTYGMILCFVVLIALAITLLTLTIF